MAHHGDWPGPKGRVLVQQYYDDIPAGFVSERIAQRGAAIDVVSANDSEQPDPRDYDFLVSLGSYDSAYDDSLDRARRAQQLITTAIDHDIPVFGICFGAQALTLALGGTVVQSAKGPEIAWVDVKPDANTSPEAIPPIADAIVPGPWLAWHHDEITAAPDGAVVLAHSDVALQAFSMGPHLAVQFHPEAMLENIARWAAHDESGLGRVGTSGEELLAQSAADVEGARQRCDRLTDAFVSQCFER